jgi:RNA polymerase sigma-70 factor, ECF subfamily
MQAPSTGQITRLLTKWANGDQTALDELMPLVYEELRRQARRYLRQERAGHTLQTTAIVNEAYLRLVKHPKTRWQDRTHFFALAATLMRRILVDHARARHRIKRGGDATEVSLDTAVLMSPQRSHELLALDEALKRLATIDERKSRVVELRAFGGLNNEEVAEILKISPNTVTRDWNMAAAWLRREIGEAK